MRPVACIEGWSGDALLRAVAGFSHVLLVCTTAFQASASKRLSTLFPVLCTGNVCGCTRRDCERALPSSMHNPLLVCLCRQWQQVYFQLGRTLFFFFKVTLPWRTLFLVLVPR